jgi:hypothetical protein
MAWQNVGRHAELTLQRPRAPECPRKEDERDLAAVLAKRPVKISELERMAIEAALRRTGGNMTRAMRQLGIGRTTLYRKLKKYLAAGQIDPTYFTWPEAQVEPVEPVAPAAPLKWAGRGRESLEALRG